MSVAVAAKAHMEHVEALKAAAARQPHHCTIKKKTGSQGHKVTRSQGHPSPSPNMNERLTVQKAGPGPTQAQQHIQEGPSGHQAWILPEGRTTRQQVLVSDQ